MSTLASSNVSGPNRSTSLLGLQGVPLAGRLGGVPELPATPGRQGTAAFIRHYSIRAGSSGKSEVRTVRLLGLAPSRSTNPASASGLGRRWSDLQQASTREAGEPDATLARSTAGHTPAAATGSRARDGFLRARARGYRMSWRRSGHRVSRRRRRSGRRGPQTAPIRASYARPMARQPRTAWVSPLSPSCAGRFAESGPVPCAERGKRLKSARTGSPPR